jgi:hypothetical protein
MSQGHVTTLARALVRLRILTVLVVYERVYSQCSTRKIFFSPASPLYLFDSHRCPALHISIPAESPAGECAFARSQMHTSVIVISHSLNMRMRQAGASRMLHCLAAGACEFMCEVSVAVQGIKTFKSLPEKHRSHPKNPAHSARLLL